ncbi:MAG: PRC-barrel domain-containing protein [Thermoleophilaceae bacterium]
MHSLVEARSWIEARVDDVYGSRVGKVVDVYFDPDGHEVHWMLVRVGSDEGPLTLVPVHYSIASRAHVWVPITKDLITRAPELESGGGVSREDELEFCFHYGGLRRRGEALRHRPADTLTAVPCGSVVPFPPPRGDD